MSRDISPTTTLGDIAARWPELIPALEARNLDYCCGGRATVAEAAVRMGTDPEALAAALAVIDASDTPDDAERDWTHATMTELADHIESTHHAFVRRSLERLGVLIPKCVRAHSEDDPRLIELQTVVVAFADDMHDHMVREERVLFPWLRRLERKAEITSGPPWSVRRPIDCMVHDHDDAAAALARMHELTDGFTAKPDACPTMRETFRLLASLERDTHRHVHKENNILFPAGVRAEESRKTAATPQSTPHAAPGRRAFTLIELLMVIAIIALLIGILLPALAMARSAGRAVVCLSNSRSIATAMTIYADNDPREFFPTARMPGMAQGDTPAAPFQMSWIYLLAPYVGVETTLPPDPSNDEIRRFVEQMEYCQCPEDHSQNWDSVMMPRVASYGLNAYLTPNHPPYFGVKASQVISPAHCVLGAELTEELAVDHFMPMYWGEPPAVVSMMMQSRQWDAATQLPRVIQHTRHGGRSANYVFTDGHAGAHPFADTWVQNPGEAPKRNWFDPRNP